MTVNTLKIIFTAIALLFVTSLSAQKSNSKSKKTSKTDYLVTIKTEFGDIRLILFDKTPIHRDNFIKLAQEGYYDSTTFHRVIKNFMIQGGDPNSKPGGEDSQIGNGGPGYTLTAEINPDLTHKKGALAAARLGDAINPKKESSGSQFYIVQNATGTPHLNGGYTVFGIVIDGIEVVDKIADEKVTPRASRPLKPIRMTVSVEKMKKKKINKLYGDIYPELVKKKKKK